MYTTQQGQLPSNNVICSIPWNHLATKPSGEYRLCCLAEQPTSVFTSDRGESLLLKRDSLSTVRNCAIAKDVRKTMLSGHWHPVCNKCKKEEAAGLKSRRIFYREMETDKEFLKTAKLKTKEDGQIDPNDFPLKTLDIRIGNLCNLKCRMCDPIYSTKWYSDYQKLTNEPFFFSNGEKIFFSDENSLNKFNWHESNFFWDEIMAIASAIEHIYIIGGEPLIIKNQMKFLEKLVNAGYSSNIELEYNSNMTFLPEGIIDLWKQFKKVTVGISLDSIFNENDYIRHPSKFDVIVSNIRKLDNHVSNKFRIWITTTFQVLNVLSLPKMIDWVENSNFEFINQFPNSPLLHIHPVHTPTYYNIQCLPQKAKNKVQEKLINKIGELEEKFSRTGLRKYQKTASNLGSVIQFMKSADTEDHFKEFIEITAMLDSMRNENFSKEFPELYDICRFEFFKNEHYDQLGEN